MKINHFAKFSWVVLAYNVGVVLWGAYVRATGSGAGCGSHWPLCNGEVIPRAAQVETLIEFAHRLSSGLALILVVAMFAWAFRAYANSHPVRLGASLSLFFIITEALVGAGLVLFEWVARDASLGRVISMGVHLVNTFLLLGALTLTGWWASGGERLQLNGQGLRLWALGLGLVGVLVLGVSGSVTALGDTLFPSASLVEGIRQDFSATAHFLERARIFHPIVAVSVGFYLVFIATLLALFEGGRGVVRAAWALGILFVIQLGAGLINLALLAPVWMQIIHLLLADAVWISLVVLAANTLQIRQNQAEVPNASRQKAPGFGL